LGSAIHLFIWLLMASISEVLVFIGVVFHITERSVRQFWGGRSGLIAGAVSGIVVSAVAFGLFHLTYPAPWNTWEKIGSSGFLVAD
jgi:membrane protease YdiL (CAAX protease family)